MNRVSYVLLGISIIFTLGSVMEIAQKTGLWDSDIWIKVMIGVAWLTLVMSVMKRSSET